jgi:hypothetical protein
VAELWQSKKSVCASSCSVDLCPVSSYWQELPRHCEIHEVLFDDLAFSKEILNLLDAARAMDVHDTPEDNTGTDSSIKVVVRSVTHNWRRERKPERFLAFGEQSCSGRGLDQT